MNPWIVATVLAYNLAVLAGCAWLVSRGMSPWCFLLAWACLMSLKHDDDEGQT